MVKEAARLISEARRPIIYAGGGILKSRAAEALRENEHWLLSHRERPLEPGTRPNGLPVKISRYRRHV